MLQSFRNGILAVKQEQLAQVAQTYLKQAFPSSSVGVLAGEEMFNKAQVRLKQMNMQMKRLGSL
jgi:Zn-dependent M16 (insulinase) family peptidase